MFYSKDTYESIIEDLNRPVVSPKRREISVLRCNNVTKFYICILSMQMIFIILVKLNIIQF